MALTFNAFDTNSKPIAKIRNTASVIYLLPNDTSFQEIPETHVRETAYVCSFCHNPQSSKEQLIYHMSKTCPAKFQGTKYPSIDIQRGELVKIPSIEHEVIFITGPPGCGKSYWMNEYVRLYRSIYGKRVIMFSTHERDPTLAKDMDKYIFVQLSDSLLDDKLELKDLADSLVIFDDINSSKYPKVTKYLLGLMEDISCNGRHYNINLIYINQECRAGIITKKILTMFTHLVIFPSSGESYQCQRLLKEYCGMSKNRIIRIMSLPSRWVMFSRAKPQYILTDKTAAILGKEIYGQVNKIPQVSIYE
jgi:energy-coupling factor transporter ATP-binding protein EcfA2